MRLKPEYLKKIKKLRDEGLSQKAIAKRIGVSPPTISQALKRINNEYIPHPTKPVAMRLTDPELAFIDEQAAKASATRAEFMRRLVRGSAGLYEPDVEVSKKLTDVSDQLIRLGNNLNQVATGLNTAMRYGSQPTLYKEGRDNTEDMWAYVRELSNDVRAITLRDSNSIKLFENLEGMA